MEIRKKAFSVAEAMITLLIVSVALAAMAPIFSKKAKQIDSSECLWLKTILGGHIVRPSGNVGIGMNTTANPDSKLEINGDNEVILKLKKDGSTGHTVEIFKGNTLVLTVTADGAISVNDQSTSSNDSVLTSNGGAWRNSLRRDGGIYINATTNDQRVLSFRSPSGGETAWVNADGSSSFGGAPRGMVAFFNLNACPTGWSPINSNWNGRFPRFAGNYNICTWSESDGNCDGSGVKETINWNNVGILQGDALRPVWGTFTNPEQRYSNLQGVFGSSNNVRAAATWHTGGAANYDNTIDFNSTRVIPSANEIRPKSVTLLGCQRN